MGQVSQPFGVAELRHQPADLGRALTWLGENCDAFSLKVSARSLIRADQTVGVEVIFEDGFKAAAFEARRARSRAARTISG